MYRPAEMSHDALRLRGPLGNIDSLLQRSVNGFSRFQKVAFSPKLGLPVSIISDTKLSGSSFLLSSCCLAKFETKQLCCSAC